MNQDIIKMAQEACVYGSGIRYGEEPDEGPRFIFTVKVLERFFHMAQADMKEKCAEKVKDFWGSAGLENVSYAEGWDDAIDAAVQSIRAIGDGKCEHDLE